MKKAVLFDFDYTLADSSEGIVYCFEQVAEYKGLIRPDKNEIKRAIGMPLIDMFSSLYGLSHDQVNELGLCDEYMFIADQVAAQMTEIYPDALDAVMRLKQSEYKLGIVSTKNKNRIIDTIKLSKVDLGMDVIIGGDDVKSHKPSPEGINKVTDQLAIEIEEVVFVGDSYYDYKAALNAGCAFLAVTSGTTTKDDFINYGQNENLIFENLSQIAEYLSRKWYDLFLKQYQYNESVMVKLDIVYLLLSCTSILEFSDSNDYDA